MPYFFTKNLFRFHKVPQSRFVLKPEGIKNLPAPPFILVANHRSSVDGYLLGAEIINYIKTKVHFLAMRPRQGGWLMELVGKLWVEVVLVDELNREKAVEDSVAYLDKKHVIILFPEGKSNFSETEFLKAKTGAARIAISGKVPLVPVGILGGPAMHGLRNCIDWFRSHPKDRIKYVIGKPFTLEEYYGKPQSYKLLHEASKKIMMEIGKLTGQKYPY